MKLLELFKLKKESAEDYFDLITKENEENVYSFD